LAGLFRHLGTSEMSFGASDLNVGLLSATEQRNLLASGEISSVELLEVHLARAEALQEPINALVTIEAEQALEAAARCDRERLAGEASGALHGLSMSVKDALATARMRTTGGATELREHVPSRDAEVVARVKAAGAVVFAKSNLPRWSGDLQAFNEIFGTTNNPWDLTRGPGGSSGGAAAAVATGQTSLEIGTDIGGSIRLPAHFSGVCGHKPSFAVVPQLGYVDHVTYGVSEADINVVGPIARTMDDVMMLWDVLAGPRADQACAWSLHLPAPPTQPTKFRVAAWLDDPACPVSAAVSDVLTQAINAVIDAGIAVDTEARPGHRFDDVWEIGLPLVSAATSPGRTEAEFARLQDLAKSIDPDQAVMAMRARASTLGHRDWLALSERREHNRHHWAEFFQNFDVLLAPVAFIPAFHHIQEGNVYSRRLLVDGRERDYADLLAWTTQFGYVYLPSTVVPVGWTPDGLPVGVQVVGPYLNDRSTMVFARFLESLLGGYRVPPIAQLS
jgi:amidase